MQRRNRQHTGRTAVTLVLVAMLAVPLAFTAGSTAGAAGGGFIDLGAAVPSTFEIRPGVQQVTATGAAPFDHLTLTTPDGERILTLVADDSGQAHFGYIPTDYLVFETGQHEPLPTTDGRALPPGEYRIVNETTDPDEATDVFTVIDVGDTPSPSLYEGQTINEGFQYLEVRDGVELSIMVRFPDANFYGPGPYPTVIEYSGYSPSNPNGPEPGSRIAQLTGFATVGVNMRGSGCGGGVFDIFSPAQAADGYDVVETIARQPWVQHGQVGMIGLSYSGISQLYVGATAPPSLSAITPLSVIEDPWYQQWPGGIYNAGFTQQWLAERDRQNAPGGHNWVTERVNNGDTVCAGHQVLRKQNPDFEKFGRALEMRPADADGRKLALLVPNIDVPVYLTGGWQDEQTGSRFATMLDKFTAAPTKKFTLFNGRHPDGYTPLVLSRWLEFLQFYVARQVPKVPTHVRFFAPTVFEDEFHVAGLGFEPNRFQSFGTDYAGAKAAYEAEPTVRVIFENGTGKPDTPGAPVARFEKSFSAWPPAEAQNVQWFFGDGGALVDAPAPNRSIDRFEFDPDAGAVAYSSSGAYDFLFPQIEADWQPLQEGRGLSYLTPPLAQDVVVAGQGHVDLWFRSTAVDANLEVVLTEVYPDGNEVNVQDGLLRAGNRSVDTDGSSPGFIEHHYDAAHYQQLPAGEFVNIKVPLNPVAHPFRSGSRLRITIDTPGRDLPLWDFENPAFGTLPVHHDVARGGLMASSIVLPTVTGVPVTADRPPCDSLRGQPCRTGGYVAIENNTIQVDPVPTTTTTTIDTTTTTAPGGSTTTAVGAGNGNVATDPNGNVVAAPVVVATPRFTG